MKLFLGRKLGKRGQAPADFGVGGLISLLIMIAIGALVLYSVTDALEAEPGSYAENAIGEVEEKGHTIFQLLTILAIVVVAALIIGVVIKAIGGAATPGVPTPPPA